MDWPLEEHASAYLDGSLTPEETRTFERELAESPDVARALASALALRDLLRSMPPDMPPAGLEERIMRGLALEEPRPKEEAAPLSSWGAILAGVGWSVRGPGLAFGPLPGAQPAAAGFSQARWMLGPLGAPRTERPKPPPKPFWRRALSLAWRRRK